MNKNLAFLIFNFVGLEITWAACAYGATHENANLGVYVGLGYILLHFILSKFRLRDLKVMLVLGTIGILIDSAISKFNFISFSGILADHIPLPAWLVVLWLVFSLMLPYSLYWLRKKLTIAAIAGAIVGCFSYVLGHHLGALNLSDPLWLSSTMYFIVWGAFFPLALLLTRFFSQVKYASYREN